MSAVPSFFTGPAAAVEDLTVDDEVLVLVADVVVAGLAADEVVVDLAVVVVAVDLAVDEPDTVFLALGGVASAVAVCAWE